MDKTLTLTEQEINTLKTFLGLDLDAIGFGNKEQRILRQIRNKLKFTEQPA